jgi:hypothetical protein
MSTGTLVIGDVHGCADELDELLQRAGPDEVVLVGDLFTKGPGPVEVWTLLRELLPDRLHTVLGNHDDRLLQAMNGRRPTDKRAHHIIAQLDRVDPAWSSWLRARPLFQPVGDYVVVHAGLHPSGEIARTSRSQALELRRWPDEKSHQPFWWQVYEGSQAVIFGHDSRRGLVRVLREDRPFLVGLDTGCVYGGQLSGWFPDRDQLVQVQARKAYR